MTIRINVCGCEEEGVLETLGRVFGVDNVTLPRRSVEAVLELRAVSKDEALTALSEHPEGDSTTMEAVAYNGYEDGDEGYPTNAQLEAFEETTYAYGLDEDAAYDTTVVQDALILRALTGLGDDLMSAEIETIESCVLQSMAEASGASYGALAIARAVELGLLEQVTVEGSSVSVHPTRKLMKLFLERGLAGVREVMLEDWELYERQLWDSLPIGQHYVRNIGNKGLHKVAARWGVGIVSEVAQGMYESRVVTVFWVGGHIVATAIDDRGELGSVHIAIVQEEEPERFAELVANAGLTEAVKSGKMCVEAAPPEFKRTTFGQLAWGSAWDYVHTGESTDDQLEVLLGREATGEENAEYGELRQRAEEIIREELGGQS